MNEAYRVHDAQDRPDEGPDAPDGTLNDQDRIEIGPTPLAYAEWEAAGLILPDLHGDAGLPAEADRRPAGGA
jgi:Xaa-Pro dipeptidase